MSSLPRIEGRVPLSGVHTPTQIIRDANGVPSINARSHHDAYYALGFAHAQDRLWQMELSRRIGHGRLAEIVGQPGLGTDKFMRSLGLGLLAKNDAQNLQKETLQALEAYAAGVNSWADIQSLRLPPEFAVLRMGFEPWQVADTLVIGRLMALQLTNNWQDEILRARLANLLSADQLKFLFPGYPSDAPTTIGSIGAGILENLPDVAKPRQASNTWVIAGQKTASGKPLLANDPHLDFQAPVQWYLANVDAPGLTLSGATIPGIPFHLVGHNGRLAWGTTTTHADSVDFVLETLVDANHTQTPDGPRPITQRVENIIVKGENQPIEFIARASINGPLISDVLASADVNENQALAIQATFLNPIIRTAQSFYRLNRAVNWTSFVNALEDFHAPVQNVSYADITGNIGFITVGNVPIRKFNGIDIQDGQNLKQLWYGYVPFLSMPRSYNPSFGVLQNANNKVPSAKYPYDLGAWWPEPYRAMRLKELINNGPAPFTPAQIALMQLDNRSVPAVKLKDHLPKEGKTDIAKLALSLLQDWNGDMKAELPQPLIINAWAQQLWRDIFTPHLGEEAMKSYGRVKAQVLLEVLEKSPEWCAPMGSDVSDCQALSSASFDKALENLKIKLGNDPRNWRWGMVHQAKFQHPILSKVPVLRNFSDLSIATDGDDFSLNRGSHSADFSHVHGPGLRAIFDLSDLERSQFMIATGQSGNLLSRHYNNFLSKWRDGEFIHLKRKPDFAAILVLDPGPK